MKRSNTVTTTLLLSSLALAACDEKQATQSCVPVEGVQSCPPITSHSSGGTIIYPWYHPWYWYYGSAGRPAYVSGSSRGVYTAPKATPPVVHTIPSGPAPAGYGASTSGPSTAAARGGFGATAHGASVGS